jgi:hypothetical protein
MEFSKAYWESFKEEQLNQLCQGIFECFPEVLR